ncbi:MAG TPA: IS256 family transposase [Candidatus Methylomirabilis sp.]|nr:IS256 family transposase [Candidatus Methylomirabilis sp.]
MTRENESTVMNEVLELISEQGLDGMAEAYRILLNEAMKAERAAVLGATPYQRTEGRRGYANGFKPKTIQSRSGGFAVDVPQTRGIEFYPSALEKGVRSERALKLAIAEMYVQGVSTRKIDQILHQLCGGEVSSTEVSRCSALLDEELEKWRKRPLGAYPYLILDARYEHVRHGGSVVSCAVLIAIGIGRDGKRSLLGVSVSLSEAEVHWREFLAALQDRGLHGVKLVVSDDHAGLKAAREARFAGVPWQRCQFHLLQNAMAYVPKQEMKKEVAADLRTILHASDRREAQDRLVQVVAKYQKTAPRLVQWIQDNIADSLAILDLPAAHRRMLRTTNMLERLNKEIKRRTRVATLFPNEASLLRLASAVLIEIDQEWQTGKVYLTVEESR